MKPWVWALAVAGLVACGSPAPVIRIPEAPAARVDSAGHWPGYWRPGWRHVANSRCDTRGMVLAETAGPAAVDSDADGCADDGPVPDVYTGRTVSAASTQIDHVYPLRRAWDRAAHGWPRDKWIIFANWRPNLVPTTLNERKGDAMPGEWTPPDPRGQCAYAMIVEHTALAWHLPLTPAEQLATTNLRKACG